MKAAVKITSPDQYNQLLTDFGNKLVSTLPGSEQARVNIVQAPMFDRMQLGNKCVQVNLRTKSSGLDRYLLWVDSAGCADWVRLVGG